MQWLMLQQDKPEDLVIATAEQHSVRELAQRAAVLLGTTIAFKGQAAEETGIFKVVARWRRDAHQVPAR